MPPQRWYQLLWSATWLQEPWRLLRFLGLRTWGSSIRLRYWHASVLFWHQYPMCSSNGAISSGLRANMRLLLRIYEQADKTCKERWTSPDSVDFVAFLHAAIDQARFRVGHHILNVSVIHHKSNAEATTALLRSVDHFKSYRLLSKLSSHNLITT